MRKFKDSNFFYVYRYDIFSLSILLVLVLWGLEPLYSKGHVVFSDIAFGFTSERYLSEIFGVWNERWSTSTLLNSPRLIYILPFYFISKLFNYSGPILLKSFITALVFLSAISMYMFSKRIISIYYSKEFNFFKVFALLIGAIFYAMNPWVIFRIQHIYLLCGYSLFPLVLTFFFNAFDTKFQKQLIRNYSMLYKGVYKRNILDLFLLAFTFSVSAAAIHYFFYGIIFLCMLGFLLILKNFILYWKKDRLRFTIFIYNSVIKIGIFSLFFMLLSSYWLLPYLFSFIFKAQVSQHNVNVIDTLVLFSRNSSIKNVLYMISYWWPMFNLNSIPISFYVGGGVILFFIFYSFIFKSTRNNIIGFFSLCSILFVIVSTGIQIDTFSSGFIFFVTKVPVIGPVFRDPNKMVGLMAVSFSVLLSFGVQTILLRFKERLIDNIIKLFIIIFIIVSFYIYINPINKQYLEGFYSPVDIPKEYVDINNKLTNKDKNYSKVLYLPIADNMIQSYNGVATPFWNKNNNINGEEKATGDMQVYNSQKNTIFHHEGNVTSITYYFNFIQYLMDRGLSSNIGNLISAFGVDEFVYHKEYLGQEQRQKFNLDILSLQKQLNKKDEDKIFSIYDVKNKLPYIYNVPKKIITPYGYSKLESYSNIPNFNFKDYGVIFSTIDKKEFLNKASKEDYIEANSINDLLLSNLPKENYIMPFDVINDGEPFLKWSKTLVNNNEWLWFLSSQGIKNFPFDFDLNSGVAVTFATSKLNLMSNQLKDVEGRNVLDFNSMLRSDNFFKADNPDIFDVIANPKVSSSTAPRLKGEIMKGTPNNIWQAAKSGLIQAKENTPYKFDVLISGRGVNKLHIKFRFYDENMKELGVSYVVAPGESTDLNFVDFNGEYVSPEGSSYMKMELLSFQNPSEKTYWWIHDLKINDLSQYKSENVFEVNVNAKESEKKKLYIRTFKSVKGGNLDITVGDKKIKVNTLSNSVNKFEWIYLGDFDFKKGDNKISVSNIKGFNAVNLFATLDVDKYDEYLNKLKFTLDNNKVFSIMEAENDFNYEGNIQSERSYPKLSMGKGMSFQKGVLEKEIDIIKPTSYSFSLNVNCYNHSGGELEFYMKNLTTGKTIRRTIDCSNVEANNEKISKVIEYDTKSGMYPYSVKELEGEINNYKTITLKDIFLEEGKYKMEVYFNSNVPSVTTVKDFHKFKDNEINIVYNLQPQKEISKESSISGSINENMMNSYEKDGVMTFNFNKTSSEGWYINASNKIKVTADEEYLFNVEAISKNVRENHFKVMFLDEKNNLIDTTYIDDIDDKDKDKWNTFTQIFRVPSNAKYMQVYMLCKGSYKKDGIVQLKNYSILQYKELILLDNIIMYEGHDINNFLKVDKEPKDITFERIDTMKRKVNISNPNKEEMLINYIESPSPLWQLNLGNTKQRGDLPLNGITQGYITTETGSGNVTIILREIYYFGLGLIPIGLITFLYIYGRKK